MGEPQRAFCSAVTSSCQSLSFFCSHNWVSTLDTWLRRCLFFSYAQQSRWLLFSNLHDHQLLLTVLLFASRSHRIQSPGSNFETVPNTRKGLLFFIPRLLANFEATEFVKSWCESLHFFSHIHWMRKGENSEVQWALSHATSVLLILLYYSCG